MDPEVKRQWVEALRSGEYEQGNGALRLKGTDDQPDSFCCLGVLCDLAARQGEVDVWSLGDMYAYGTTQSAYTDFPTVHVLHWAGLNSSDPEIVHVDDDEIEHETSLAALNDEGYKFSEIADLIEEQL